MSLLDASSRRRRRQRRRPTRPPPRSPALPSTRPRPRSRPTRPLLPLRARRRGAGPGDPGPAPGSARRCRRPAHPASAAPRRPRSRARRSCATSGSASRARSATPRPRSSTPRRTELHGRVEGIVDRIVRANGFAVTSDERARLVDELVGEIGGLGPIEPFLRDEHDHRGHGQRPAPDLHRAARARSSSVDRTFLNDEHVLRIIDRIVTPLGRRIDQTSPRVDARLPDGSRVNAIIPPLSLVGPVITIRKFSATPFTVDDLVGFGTATRRDVRLPARPASRPASTSSSRAAPARARRRRSTSSRRSSPNDERIVTIEDAAELQLRQEHVVTLEARPPNLEGAGEITIRDLLRNCPAHAARPDHRRRVPLRRGARHGPGHDHGPRRLALHRPRQQPRATCSAASRRWSSWPACELPLRAIREQIASAVDLIVHTARLKDGSRKIVNITEVYGIEDDEILTQDIFVFEQTGFRDGKIEGTLKPTGIRPTFMPKFKSRAGSSCRPASSASRPRTPSCPTAPASGKGRWLAGERLDLAEPPRSTVGHGRTVKAGGHGLRLVPGAGRPGDRPGRRRRDQGADAPVPAQPQGEARGGGQLAGEGRLGDVVAARPGRLRHRSTRSGSRWFPGDAPVGQGTLMPPLQRRAGFRISLGVIAEA